MKKLLTIIKWFIFHYKKDYIISKKYYEDLDYYEYEVSRKAKLFNYFNIIIHIGTYNSHEYIKYYDLPLYITSDNILENSFTI